MSYCLIAKKRIQSSAVFFGLLESGWRGSVSGVKTLSFESMRLSRIFPILLFAVTITVHSETITGRITGISDGDTLTLLDSEHIPHKIRLSGIDAPEKKQDFGEKSKARLSALAYNRPAQADCRKIDRYQRKICVVFVDGRDVGLEQIKSGMAWWYQQYAKEQPKQERLDYEQTEDRARQQRAGLWSIKNPIPPWEWRHNGRGR